MNSWLSGAYSKRRDKINIIADILEIAKDGALKTQVLYKGNLGFSLLNEYLSLMLKIGLIEIVADGGRRVCDNRERIRISSAQLQSKESSQRRARKTEKNSIDNIFQFKFHAQVGG